jgi:hypothetical protein
MIRQQEMATTNNHLSIMSPLPTIVAATIYTFSVYAMAQQNRYLQLVFDDNGANGVYANFDLQTGTISQPVVPQGAVTNAAAAMQNVGNGIYRCSVTCATNSTTTARPVIVLINAAAATKFVSYTGSIANGLLTWGAQFEAGAFPTSYVPTTGAAVTRAVDVLTIQPANMSPWFNAGPGSWMIAATSYPAAGAPRRLINYLSGTAVYPLLVTTAGYTLASFDGVATLTTANLISAGVPFAGASVWNTGGTGAVCLNGGAVVSAATQTAGFASLLTTGVKLMSDGGSTDTGYIRRLRYWPRVLSNTELQQVTA